MSMGSFCFFLKLIVLILAVIYILKQCLKKQHLALSEFKVYLRVVLRVENFEVSQLLLL